VCCLHSPRCKVCRVSHELILQILVRLHQSIQGSSKNTLVLLFPTAASAARGRAAVSHRSARRRTEKIFCREERAPPRYDVSLRSLTAVSLRGPEKKYQRASGSGALPRVARRTLCRLAPTSAPLVASSSSLLYTGSAPPFQFLSSRRPSVHVTSPRIRVIGQRTTDSRILLHTRFPQPATPLESHALRSDRLHPSCHFLPRHSKPNI
jgi:hypothetical protein